MAQYELSSLVVASGHSLLLHKSKPLTILPEPGLAIQYVPDNTDESQPR